MQLKIKISLQLMLQVGTTKQITTVVGSASAFIIKNKCSHALSLQGC